MPRHKEGNVSKNSSKFAFLAVVTALVGCHNQSADRGSSDRNDLASSVAAAQAEANRPADASQNCQALEKEFKTLMKDPAIQSYMVKNVNEAQKNQNGESPEVQRAASLQNTQNPTKQQRAEAMQKMQEHMQQMSEIMPQLARAQRLAQLSAERNCAWTGMPQGYTPSVYDSGH
jgi:hypothetical protein